MGEPTTCYMVPLIVNRDSESDALRADGSAEDLRLARARIKALEKALKKADDEMEQLYFADAHMTIKRALAGKGKP